MFSKIKDTARKTKGKIRGIDIFKSQQSTSTSGTTAAGLSRTPTGAREQVLREETSSGKHANDCAADLPSPSTSKAADSLAASISETTRALTGMHTVNSAIPTSLDNAVAMVGEVGSSDIIDTAASLVDKLSAFLKFVDTLGEIHPYAKMATIIITSIAKVFVAQAKRDAALQGLLDSISDIYTFVTRYNTAENLDNDRQKLLKELSLRTVDCAYFIRDQAEVKSFLKRMGRNALIGSNIDAYITDYKNAFLDLRQRLDQRGGLETEIHVVKMIKSLSEIQDSIDLQNLAYVRFAGVNVAKACLKGTRTQILDDLSTWVNDPKGSRVRFLLGLAGTGKSAIAHSLGARFDTLQRLGCFFAFSRDFQGDRHPESVLSTVAHEIAGWNPDFKHALAAVLRDKPSLCHTTDIAAQWDGLLVAPAKAVAFVGPVLIIIDAFDESSSTDERSRRLLLSRLTHGVELLQSNFRILVTSRPEEDVMAVLSNLPAPANSPLVDSIYIDHSTADVNADVEAYIRHTLKSSTSPQRNLDDARVLQLVEKASGLFQWANIACRAILEKPAGRSLQERFDKRLGTILRRKSSSLDDLYSEMLQQVFEVDDPTVMSRFRSVMAQILCTSQPLSSDTHQTIRSHSYIQDATDVSDVVTYMGAFLFGLDGHSPIHPVHTTFRDFLFDESRSGIWHVNTDEGHYIVCMGLLALLNQNARFNFFNIKTSYEFNLPEPGLMLQETSPGLVYAAGYMKDHIPPPPETPILVDTALLAALRELLCNKLLFWLEILSMLQHVNTAVPVIQQAARLFSPSDHLETQNALQDAMYFVRRFSQPISQSIPHIYISALPFSPEPFVLRSISSSSLPRVPKISGIPSHWSRMQAVFHGKFRVYAVSWSQDGRHITSGAYDSNVRIWDAYTGELVREPLKGHSERVNSVAFSPDCLRIVSASNDKTLRIWDAVTGDMISGPLSGHSERVESACYAPDGRHIASGSGDATIRLWDAANGKVVGEPFYGHSTAISTVAYSPDSRKIVSGSYDRTIRIWDASTGQTIHMLDGHTDSVRAVAYSPDGSHIVSGSSDTTLCIWDAQTGETVGEPIRGHSGRVSSVAYSPDGRHIVSGSSDASVRIWNAVSGVAVGASLTGHFASVYAVTYSPDGRQIVSGANDGTMRIWNADTSLSSSEPSISHTPSVYAVTFSPDGCRIFASSEDCTLREWDPATGKAVGEPFRGQGSVESITCSPDGRRIVLGSYDRRGHSVCIWNVETGETIGQPLSWHTDYILSVALAPDGRRIASASADSTIRIWNVDTGHAVGAPFRGHSDKVNSVAYAPDGMCVVSGADDLTVRIWDTRTAKVVGKPMCGHSAPVLSVAFSPDGRHIVSGSRDLTVRIWNVSQSKAVGEPLRGHSNAIFSVAYSPDCRRIVSGSKDCTVRIWDADTGESIGRPLHGHCSLVHSVTFSPDCCRMASGSWDGTVRLWDLDMEMANHQPLLNFAYSSSSAIPGPTASPASGDDQLQLCWQERWITDDAGNLLIWVPDEYRNSLSWPRTRMLIGGREPRVKIDFGDTRHGTEWAECMPQVRLES
ncbi:WD40 repeat-like protein [Mycena venus]|uniref:WD40 repeat-like protein n=1 Tax=Mycena venus TaxID=2733690 RepID=A0A8H6YL49_9AGAR|nr:WD40 repeat-like protein [Mycena venus]